MPFIQSKNIVVEKEILAEITPQEQKDKPSLSSLVMLQGGQGGSFGEKSFKPKVILADADINSSELSLNSSKIYPYSTTEIKSENDCGYAIDFKTDASNQCDFNIGEYDPYNNLNIYSSSQLLPFSQVFTGGASSSAPLYSGYSAGNFQVIADPTYANFLTPVLDSELNLNKYYLELRNAADVSLPFYLQKTIDFSDVGTSVFVFYVAQTDLVSGYATYNTGVINFNRSAVSATGGFYDTIFEVGDLIYISHPSGYYGIQAEISAKDAQKYTFNIEKTDNLPSTNIISFPLGSSVSIIDETNSNKLSICKDNSTVFPDMNSYNNTYLDSKYGFQFNIAKNVTTNHKELSSSVFFSSDKKLFSEQANPIGINASFSRIGNRKYMQDQYGTDLVKNQIKNKSKFNIFYHGLERNLSQSNNNTSQTVTTYSCGNDVSSFVSNTQINQDVLGPLLNEEKVIKLIIGSPVKTIGGIARCYYSNRIYEVLIYINLKSSDVPKVLMGLSKKYSQKTSFSSPVEFQASDMYYSATDKINILGKIKKTST